MNGTGIRKWAHRPIDNPVHRSLIDTVRDAAGRQIAELSREGEESPETNSIPSARGESRHRLLAVGAEEPVRQLYARPSPRSVEHLLGVSAHRVRAEPQLQRGLVCAEPLG